VVPGGVRGKNGSASEGAEEEEDADEEGGGTEEGDGQFLADHGLVHDLLRLPETRDRVVVVHQDLLVKIL